MLKSSTEVAIHCIINTEINMYEARLQNLVENRDMASCEKVRRIE
jgi:hypothetical protein